MAKFFNLIILGLIVIFSWPHSASALYEPIYCPAPDQNLLCGKVTDANSFSISCDLSGPAVDTGTSNRILGGQKCSIGGQDNGGYYMMGLDEPSHSTVTFPYGASLPSGWSFDKHDDLTPLISGEEVQMSLYSLGRFFGGYIRNTTYYDKDDEVDLTVGSYFGLWEGCQHDSFRSVSNPLTCPSLNFGESTPYPYINVSDSVVFNVQNDLRPSGGYPPITSTWGAGWVSVGLEVTECSTAEELAWRNTIGYNYQNIVTYHPTARGVCAPEAPTPTPALSAQWTENSLTSKTISTSATECVLQPNGSKNCTIPLNFWNSGQSRSSVTVTNCSYSRSDNTFSADVSLCPEVPNIILTVP